MRARASIRPLLLLLAAAPLAGCGYIGGAIALAVAGGGSGGGGGVAPASAPPLAQVVELPRGDATAQTVRIRVADAEGDAVTALLEYRDEGEGAPPFAPATIVAVLRRSDGASLASGPAAGATPALATSPAGIEYDLVWAWRADLGGSARRAATVRLSIVGSATPPATATGKVGNDPPALAAAAVEGREGRVVVRYELGDSTADVCAVLSSLRIDGAEEPLTGVVGGRTAGLATAPAAQTVDFTWDTAVRLGGRDVTVDLVLVAVDEVGARSAPVEVAGIAIDNNRPPVVVVAAPARAPAGRVEVRYIVIDPEGDPVNITVRRRREAETDQDLAPATPGAGGDGVTGLASSPTGTPHLFVWDSTPDLGGPQAERVVVAVRPVDIHGNAGAEQTSAVLVAGNDAPTVEIAVDDPAAGDVPVAVTLFDGSADPASLEAEYDTGSTPAFLPCTIRVPAGAPDPLGLQATTAAGDPAEPARPTIVWDSAADLPDAFETPVVLRVRATDVFGARSAFVEVATVLTNAAPQTPPSVIADPAATLAARQAGPVVDVPFRLVDAQADPADVVVEFTTDGLRGTYVRATPAAGEPPATALATSATGVDQVFRWNAAADLEAAAAVTLRIAATDTVGGGAAFATVRATVLNDAPRATVSAAPVPNTSIRGFAAVSIILVDSTADPTAVQFDVVIRTAAGTVLSTQPATVAGAGTLLQTDAAGGRTYEFLWNSLADLGGTAPDDIRLSVRPVDDRGAEGTALEVGPYANANGDRPVVAIGTIARVPGEVAIPLVLADAQGDAATLEIAYSPDGGATFFPLDDAFLRSADGPATGAAARTDLATTGPAGEPERSHTLLWDAPADLFANRGLAGAVPLLLRVRGRDAIGFGDPAEAALVAGNDAPSIAAVLPDAPALIVVPFAVTIADSTADPVAVVVEFSLDGGATFLPATIVAGEVAGVATSAGGGAVLRLAWNAGLDLTAQAPGIEIVAGVLLRATADDFPGDGVPPPPASTATSAPFDVFLSDKPIALVKSPLPGGRVVPQGGLFTVEYILFDLASDPAEVAVAFDLGAAGGGAGPQAATAGPGTDGPLGVATSPEGTPHAFVWQVGQDIAGDRAGVTLTVSVRQDAADPFATATVAGLEIDGNAAPTVRLDDFGGVAQAFVDIAGTVRDAEGDDVDLEFRVSFDGGVSFVDATVVPLMVDLASTAAGVRHRASWALADDLVAAGVEPAVQTSTVFEVTPVDGDAGVLSRGPVYRTTLAAFDAAVVLGTPSADLSSVVVSPAPARLPADGVATASVTVTVVDVTGAPAPGHTVALSFSLDGATASAPSTSNAGGVYAGTLRSVVAGTGRLTVLIDPGPAQIALDAGDVIFDPPTPGAIADLAAAYAGQTNRLRLLWTATGDDGTNGTAASYVIKVATSPIASEAAFAAAATVTQSFTPLPSGSAEDRTIDQAWYVGTRHFALRAVDAGGNAGPISNPVAVDLAASATFPAATADFGTVAIGTFLERSFVVTNTAAFVDLTIASTALAGDATFTIASGGVAAGSPVVLAPGGARTVVGRYLPVDLVAGAATLSIASTTTGISSPRTVALSGTGVPAGVNHAPALPAASVGPALVTPGAMVTLSVDGRDLESALPGTDAIASVTIDLTRAGGGAAVPMTAGAVVDAQTRTYTHVLDTTGLAAGAYAFGVTATDTGGLTATRRLLLLVYTGDVIDVAADGTGDVTTIGAGIAAAAPAGDLVLVHDGTYSGDGNRNLAIGGKQVVIASANGPAAARVDLTTTGGAVFVLDASGETRDTAIIGLTFRKAGAAALFLRNGPSPTVASCRFEENTNAADGGAVRLEGAATAPLFLDCTFVQNTRTGSNAQGGAVFSSGAAPVFEGCLFDRNTAVALGGAVVVAGGPATFVRSTFLANETVVGGTGQGGAIGYTSAAGSTATVSVRACVFDGNKANAGDGGGIGGVPGGGTTDLTFVVEDSDFVRNVPSGVFWRGNTSDATRGRLFLTRCTFNANAGKGGVQFTGARLAAAECLFVGNTGADGGGLAASSFATTGPVEVVDSSFIANQAQMGGAAAASTTAANPLRITRCTFQANVATTLDGGALRAGNAVVVDSVFSRNRARGGGAVHVNTGAPSFDGCVFDENEAQAGDGGAFLVSSNGALGLASSLVVRNTASGGGGGLHLAKGMAVTLRAVTVAENQAGASGGGGILFAGGATSPLLTHSIVWANQATGAGDQVLVTASGAAVNVAFADIAASAADIFDTGNLINGGAGFIPGANGNLAADPLFVAGPQDDFSLAQLPGEAPLDAVSPCVDVPGAGTAAALGVAGRTTRSDGAPDADPADLGYHRKP